jgi:hypothetical protein
MPWFVVNFCVTPRGGGFVEAAAFVEADDAEQAAIYGMDVIDQEADDDLDEGYASSIYATELGDTFPFNRTSSVEPSQNRCCAGGGPSGHSGFCPEKPEEAEAA